MSLLPLRLKQRIFWGVFCLIIVLLPSLSFGEVPREAPVPVTVGVYITDIYDIDLKKGAYTTDFYIWFNWKGNVNPRRFEIVNGYIISKKFDSYATVNGVRHLSFRCRAVLHGQFNLSDYPWDSQLMSIMIEDDDEDATQLIYVADIDNSKIQSGIKVADRIINGFKLFVTTHVYNTSFGNPARETKAKSTYSRFVVELLVVHVGIRGIIKTFLSLFISVAIAFLTFLIRPNDLPPRFSMGITGLFGAVSSQIVLHQLLDECPYLTVADKIHYVALFFIFLSILESAIALNFFHKGNELVWKRMDLYSQFLFPAFFTLTAILFITFR